jgi:hypothetical protein
MLTGETRTTMFVDYGRYFLRDSEAGFASSGSDGTGLLEQGPFGVVGVVCGTHTGPIHFDVQWHDSAPAVDFDGWEEIAETDFECGSGRISLGSAFDWPMDIEAAFGPGVYRLRVHARGRDEGDDGEEIDDVSVEHHMIALWPTAPAPMIFHKATDRTGAYWRGTAKSSLRPVLDSTVAEPYPDRLGPVDRDRSAFAMLNRTLVQRRNLVLALTTLVVHPHGCYFYFAVKAERADLADAAWERLAERVQQGFERRPKTPPKTPSDALVVSASWAGGPLLRTDDVDSDGSSPLLSGYWMGGAYGSDTATAEHKAWLWPLPPAEPLELTLHWPALGIDAVTTSVDAASIRAAALNL